MKIVQGLEYSRVEKHAAKLIKALEARTMKYEPMRVRPQGIPVHQAVFPITCDTCGETFWATDEYASHIRCPGPPSKLGFA